MGIGFFLSFFFLLFYFILNTLFSDCPHPTPPHPHPSCLLTQYTDCNSHQLSHICFLLLSLTCFLSSLSFLSLSFSFCLSLALDLGNFIKQNQMDVYLVSFILFYLNLCTLYIYFFLKTKTRKLKPKKNMHTQIRKKHWLIIKFFFGIQNVKYK